MNHPELPEQEGVYVRRLHQSEARASGQTMADAVDGLTARSPEWLRYALSLPVWIDETQGEQSEDGSEPFMLDFDGLDSGISLL